MSASIYKEQPINFQLKSRQLQLQVVGIPNPQNTPSNFTQNQTFRINQVGLDQVMSQNQNKQQGTVSIGRYKPQAGHQNDIEFHEDDTLVSSRQCQIICSNEQFFIQCISEAQLTFQQVMSKGMPLQEGTIFQLGSDLLFYIKKIEVENNLIDLFAWQNYYDVESQPMQYGLPQQNPLTNFSQQPTIPVKYLQNQNMGAGITKTKKIGSKITIGTFGLIYGNSFNQNSSYHLNQNDIIIDTTEEKSLEPYYFPIGRNQHQNKIVLPQDQISELHCQIIWSSVGDWRIGEKLNQQQYNYSENGTFVALKNYQEMINARPSAQIMLEQDMVIWIEQTKFKVNYLN